VDQPINEKLLENINFSDVFNQLSKDQLRFVVAMQECTSKKEAAEKIKLNPNSVYNWPDVVGEAIKLMALDITESARVMRKRALAKAIAVQTALLESDDERIRLSASKEIIDSELGKAMQQVDLTTDGDKINNDDPERIDRAISTFADAIGEIISRKGTAEQSAMDAAERTPVDGALIES